MTNPYLKKDFGYYATLFDSSNVCLGTFTDFYKINYRKVLNDVGVCSILVPTDHNIIQYISDDVLIEISLTYPRKDGSTSNYNLESSSDFLGLYRDNQILTDENGKKYFNLLFPSTVEILTRYINAYPTGVDGFSQWTATELAVIARDLIRYNLTSDATTTNGRILNAEVIKSMHYGSAVAGTDAVDYAIDFKNILEALKELAGLLTFDFDVQRYSLDETQLETIQKLKSDFDISNTEIFSLYLDNAEGLTYQTDRLAEKTVAIVGGKNTGLSRTFQIEYGDNYSATNHYEVFVDASSNEDVELSTIGQAKLKELKAKNKVRFNSIASNKHIYKRDYNLGDTISIEVDGTITARQITAVDVTFDDSGIPQITIEIENN